MNRATVTLRSADRPSVDVMAGAVGPVEAHGAKPAADSLHSGGKYSHPAPNRMALDVMVGTISLVICLAVLFRQEITFLMAGG